MAKLVISSVGKDRPGIVGAFTRVLYNHNCSIEDASMTILCNQFAMILIISTPEELSLADLKESLESVEKDFGLCTTITHLETSENGDSKAVKFKPYMIIVSGTNKTGIAYHITDILSNYNVNITDFNSKLVSKKEKPVYIMMIETQVPDTCDFSKLKKALKSKAKEINVDLKINEIECFKL